MKLKPTDMNKLFFVLMATLIISCQSDQNQIETNEGVDTPQIVYPQTLQRALDAHGGLDTWQSMKRMEYTFVNGEKKEQHLIDLQNRKVRIERGDTCTVGFDGNEVWVQPNRDAFGRGSARFYHNLYFYFFAMPYVLADPGIKYKALPDREFNGQNYNGVSIKYQDGVGDASDDEYILYINEKTGQMEYLFYTVTYYSKEPGDRYSCLHYHTWKEADGLLLPQVMSRYDYANGVIGEKRYDRSFEDVKLNTERPDQTVFEMPAGAEIDTLK